MQIGDLVRYVPTSKVWDEFWKDHRGVIIRCIGGTDKVKVVLWMNGTQQGISARNLEIVNAG